MYRNNKVYTRFNAGKIARFRQGYENRADGLTPPRLLLDNHRAVSTLLTVGRENPNGTGENSPQPIVAFLCPSYCAGLCRARSLWRGYFGKPYGLPHLFAVFSPQLNPAAHAVRSMIGGCPPLEQDSPHEPTRHPRPKSAYPRPSQPPRTRENETPTLGKPWGRSSPPAPHPREPSRRQTGLRDTQNPHGLCLAVWRSALHFKEKTTGIKKPH